MNRSFQNTGMEKTTWYFKAKKSFKSMLEELDAGRRLMGKVANYTKFCRVARGNVLAVLDWVGAVAVWVASRPEACRLSQLQGCGFESAPLTSIA